MDTRCEAPRIAAAAAPVEQRLDLHLKDIMNLFISADIEGVAGICSSSEGDHAQQSEYRPFRQQMTAEVAAACAGGFSAGAHTIVVKDAHYSGRNLDLHQLVAPAGKHLHVTRGWSGHPFSMVQGLDASFDALAFVGYHSAGGRGGNPLSHTMSGAMFARVELNGVIASEFLLFSYAAASVGVPVVFLSGDAALCDEAQTLIDNIVTVPTMEGIGASVTSITPVEAVRRIEEGMNQAMAGKAARPLVLPKSFNLKLVFNKHADAYEKSFYPGVKKDNDTELVLESAHYFDILTFLMFACK